MIHMNLQIAPTDPKVFVVEPFGVRIDVHPGDKLAVELDGPQGDEPELVRTAEALTLYLQSGYTVQIVINGQQKYHSNRPLPPLPRGVSAREFAALMGNVRPQRTEQDVLQYLEAPPPPMALPSVFDYVCPACNVWNDLNWSRCKKCWRSPINAGRAANKALKPKPAGMPWKSLGQLVLIFEMLAALGLMVYFGGRSPEITGPSVFLCIALGYCFAFAKNHPGAFLVASALNTLLPLLASAPRNVLVVGAAVVTSGVLFAAYAQAERQLAKRS
jgi:hypothetical protein